MSTNNMIAFLFSFVLLLTACTNNTSNDRKKNVDNRLTLEDPEHHIKDSPDILKHDSTILYTGWYYVLNTQNGYKRLLEKMEETYYLDPKPIVSAKNFTRFQIYENKFNGATQLNLGMWLDKEGTESWSNATLRAKGNKLAFILDNRLLQVAIVNSQITSGVTALNRGDYSRQELENFKNIIESEK